MKQDILTFEFLETKIHKDYDCHSSNITRLNQYIYVFEQYNFLPTSKDSILDGHFTIYVNITNFKYILYKSSYYGGLTYTTPSDNETFITKLTDKIDKITIESIIANKLLRSYHYDSNHVNHKGNNLIEQPNLYEGGYTKSILISTWQTMEISKKDIEAMIILSKNLYIQKHVHNINK